MTLWPFLERATSTKLASLLVRHDALAKNFAGNNLLQGRGIEIWRCIRWDRRLVRGLPFRNEAYTVKQGLIWVQKARIRPQCRVTTALWAPGADSGQRAKPRNRGAKFRPKNGFSARPWGRRAMILSNERCILKDCLGHSANVLRDSAVYLRK